MDERKSTHAKTWTNFEPAAEIEANLCITHTFPTVPTINTKEYNARDSISRSLKAGRTDKEIFDDVTRNKTKKYLQHTYFSLGHKGIRLHNFILEGDLYNHTKVKRKIQLGYLHRFINIIFEFKI